MKLGLEVIRREFVKMFCYLFFPVVVFHIYNSPETYGEWTAKEPPYVEDEPTSHDIRIERIKDHLSKIALERRIKNRYGEDDDD